VAFEAFFALINDDFLKFVYAADDIVIVPTLLTLIKMQYTV